MKTVKLHILAEDIKSTDFIDSTNCAITRALGRAGVDARHTGCTISDNETNKVLTTNLNGLEYKVIRMYAHLDKDWNKVECPNKWTRKCAELGTLEPSDFEFEIEIED